MIFLKKVSQCRKKPKGGPFGIFQHPFCRKTPKKLKGDPLVEKKIKKVAQCQNNLKGDPLVSSGIVCYAGNLFGSVPWANGYNLAAS